MLLFLLTPLLFVFLFPETLQLSFSLTPSPAYDLRLSTYDYFMVFTFDFT